jgi:four helix bundle protein
MSPEFGAGDLSMKEKFSFEHLLVYRKVLDYVDCVYEWAREFPKEEKFGLAGQFQRAAQSIALNIGKGSGGSKAEFRHFIKIARRSVMECIVCATLARRKDYLSEKDEAKSREMASRLSKMLSGLFKAI